MNIKELIQALETARSEIGESIEVRIMSGSGRTANIESIQLVGGDDGAEKYYSIVISDDSFAKQVKAFYG